MAVADDQGIDVAAADRLQRLLDLVQPRSRSAAQLAGGVGGGGGESSGA